MRNDILIPNINQKDEKGQNNDYHKNKNYICDSIRDSDLSSTHTGFFDNLNDRGYNTCNNTSPCVNNDDTHSRIPQNKHRTFKYINQIKILNDKDNYENTSENSILYSDIQTMKSKYGFNIHNPLSWKEFKKIISTKYSHLKYNYIEQLYFHYILVIGNIHTINDWLCKYIDTHSMDNLEIIINSPISVPVEYNGKKHGYSLYPINTYSLWNHDPKGIRLLVSFGAEVCMCDNYGYYPEEAIRNISYFHPIPFLIGIGIGLDSDNNLDNTRENIDKNNKIYYRNHNEFKAIIDEIRYIAGEDISMNWTYPI